MSNRNIDEIYVCQKYKDISIINIDENYREKGISLKEVLFYCIYTSNLDLMRHLFTIQPNLNFFTPDNRSSAIYFAEKIGNVEIINYIKNHNNFRNNRFSKEMEKIDFFRKYSFTIVKENDSYFFGKIKKSVNLLKFILEDDSEFIVRNSIEKKICEIYSEHDLETIVNYICKIDDINFLNCIKKIKLLIKIKIFEVSDYNIEDVVKKLGNDIKDIIKYINITEKIFNNLFICDLEDFILSKLDNYKINIDYLPENCFSICFGFGNKKICNMLMKYDINKTLLFEDLYDGINCINDINFIKKVIDNDKNFAETIRKNGILGRAIMNDCKLFEYILEKYPDCNKSFVFEHDEWEFLSKNDIIKIYEKIPDYKIDNYLFVRFIVCINDDDIEFTKFLFSKINCKLEELFEDINFTFEEDKVLLAEYLKKAKPNIFLEYFFLQEAIDNWDVNKIKVFFTINEEYIVDSELFIEIFRICCDTYECFEFIEELYNNNYYNIDLSYDNESILKIIIDRSSSDYFEWLLENNPDIDITFDNHYAFRGACRLNKTTIVRLIIDMRPDIYEAEIYNTKIFSWNIKISVEYETNNNIRIDCCSICYENNNSMTDCGHLFCLDCINKLLKNTIKCPYCRKKIEKIYVKKN